MNRILAALTPEPQPSLDELLEGFWGGKDPSVLSVPTEQLDTVWVLTTIDCTERGPDAFLGSTVFATKEDALWCYWMDELDTASDGDYFYEDFGPTEWLTQTLTELQNLRDDNGHFDGDMLYTLQPQVVHR